MTIPVWFQDWYNNGSGGIAAAAQTYIDRVEADGGAVESIGCVPSAVWDWTTPSFIGLLDLFPGAAAGYSLRKLRAAYSGSAIRVRKEVSSVSSETDIGFLGDGTLDTTTLLTFASDADGGDVFVVTWYDQSLSNNATQSTGANQPKIVSSGAVITEGTSAKPAIEFDGVDDYLAKIATFTINGDHMIMAVHTPEALGGYLFSFGYNDPESVLLWTNSANYSRYWVNGSVDILNSGENVAGQRLTTGEMSSGAQTLYVNAAQNSTKSTTYNGGDVPDITIGYAVQRAQGLNYLTGKVQELIFFNSDQSTTRTGIETNINTFYSIYP